MGQLRLIDLLREMTKEVSYVKPNFDFEWEEAIRYPEFEEMGKLAWIELANSGKAVTYSSIKDRLGNVDLDFAGLDANKKARFKSAVEKGKIEMPIVVKFPDGEYDLVAGNTRLSGLVDQGIDPKLWVVELPNQ